MQKLLKFTYLMQPEKVEKRLDFLWGKYQKILKNPNWKSLNEARAILYLIGDIYLEKIAPGAVERRLHLLKKPLSLLEFFTLIDSNSIKLADFKIDKLFLKLEKFYKIIKKFKNLHTDGKHYLDEEKFIKLYNKYNPNKNDKIDYMGKFSK